MWDKEYSTSHHCQHNRRPIKEIFSIEQLLSRLLCQLAWNLSTNNEVQWGGRCLSLKGQVKNKLPQPNSGSVKIHEYCDMDRPPFASLVSPKNLILDTLFKPLWSRFPPPSPPQQTSQSPDWRKGGREGGGKEFKTLARVGKQFGNCAGRQGFQAPMC